MVTGQQELQQEVEKGVFRQERDPLVKDDEAKKEGARAKYGSAKSAKRNWGVLKESIVDHSVFIHHDESNKSKENTKWSDINEEEYELTLRECFFLILILLGCGVIAFSFVFEQWPILDSLYFTTVILTTVGYGDITPKTKAGKLFATVFALGGIVILGLALGVLGSKLVEAEIEASEKLKKKRSKAFSKAMSSSETTESNQSFDSAEADIAFPEQEEIQTGCTRVFDLFKEYIPAIGPCVIGGLLIAMEENWGWVDALYYCVVTSTTIGFGDLTPTTTMSKIWALIFIPLAVAAMGYILGNLASQIIDRKREKFNKALWSTDLTCEDLGESNNSCYSTNLLSYVYQYLTDFRRVNGL